MKRVLPIILVLLLILIAIIQIMAARGVFPKREKQSVCPVDAIYMENGKAKIDSVKCIGCRRCVEGFIAIPNMIVPDPLASEAIPANDSDVPTQIQIEAENPPEERVKVKNPSVSQINDIRMDSTILAQEEERQKRYQVVDASTCIACGFCLKVCPEGAITYQDGKAYIDPDKCINCGICLGNDPKVFKGCPVDAIHPSSGH